jgi:hypothetical protein
MANLTPLSKGIIGLAVVGAMASVVWHLVLKERVSGIDVATWKKQFLPGSTASEPSARPPQNANAPAPAADAAPVKEPTPDRVSGAYETGRRLMASGNLDEARKHLEIATREGSGAAACLLGEMTLRGQGGIPASLDASAQLFQLAQSRGNICFSTNK